MKTRYILYYYNLVVDISEWDLSLTVFPLLTLSWYCGLDENFLTDSFNIAFSTSWGSQLN